MPDGVLINGRGPYRYNTTLVPDGIEYETINVDPGIIFFGIDDKIFYDIFCTVQTCLLCFSYHLDKSYDTLQSNFQTSILTFRLIKIERSHHFASAFLELHKLF